MKPNLGCLCLLPPFLAISSAVAADAGRFQFVAGEVQVLRADGVARPAAKGEAVQEGETVVTGVGAAAQLRMVDDGLIAVRPDSRLRIDTYRFQGKEDGSEQGVLGLLKGGFRTLTGVIGRLNKSAYLVRTPTATIGIRGTDHEPVFIPVEGGWSGAPGAEPGTYNKVNTGETFIETAGGRIELAANQVGFVPPRLDAAPARLERVPEFLRATPAPQARDNRSLREGRDTGDARRLAEQRREPGAVGTVMVRPGAVLPPPTLPGTLVQPPPVQDPVSNPANVGITAAPAGMAVAGGDLSRNTAGTFLGSGAGYVGPNDLYILVDQERNPVLVADTATSGGSFQYLRNGAPLLDRGGATVDGVIVRWGIYAGGTISDSQGSRDVERFHFISAPDARNAADLAAIGGSHTFTFVAGTTPVNELGQVGGSYFPAASTVTVDFSNGKLTDFKTKVVDARGLVFNGTSGAVNVPLATLRDQGVSLSVSCTGACASTGSGNGHGIVFGPNGGGFLGSYDMKASDGKGVTGSVVLQR